MTAVSALLLALLTGWMVPAPRLAMAAFLGPWLVALIYQTADIGEARSWRARSGDPGGDRHRPERRHHQRASQIRAPRT